MSGPIIWKIEQEWSLCLSRLPYIVEIVVAEFQIHMRFSSQFQRHDRTTRVWYLLLSRLVRIQIGNENVDKLAKAALNKASYSKKLICWSDLKPKVNAYIHTVWQKNWDTEGANKLHEVLPDLGEDLSEVKEQAENGRRIAQKRGTLASESARDLQGPLCRMFKPVVGALARRRAQLLGVTNIVGWQRFTLFAFIE
ncbi:ribonuclease hi [Plakobranchus ocellatus]|uniref:Ribonuclease hi n=1 Tax=Plakobranchus ocellatus TaxID=259542 RepID=A0AAV4DKR1_9GAST|nr:ribonuclease hi [Plakobranchus ocellatus]